MIFILPLLLLCGCSPPEHSKLELLSPYEGSDGQYLHAIQGNAFAAYSYELVEGIAPVIHYAVFLNGGLSETGELLKVDTSHLAITGKLALALDLPPAESGGAVRIKASTQFRDYRSAAGFSSLISAKHDLHDVALGAVYRTYAVSQFGKDDAEGGALQTGGTYPLLGYFSNRTGHADAIRVPEGHADSFIESAKTCDAAILFYLDFYEYTKASSPENSE
jgi:hypothetical protein